MAEPTIIKCSKCYIYKHHLKFVKDGSSKKLLKLCQLCRSKVCFPSIVGFLRIFSDVISLQIFILHFIMSLSFVQYTF
jgi:hypothetical protein